MREEVLFQMVMQERARQDEKWGVQDHTLPEWAAILGEEFGELCQEILRIHFGKRSPNINLETEAVQVMAVVVAMLDDLQRAGELLEYRLLTKKE